MWWFRNHYWEYFSIKIEVSKKRTAAKPLFVFSNIVKTISDIFFFYCRQGSRIQKAYLSIQPFLITRSFEHICDVINHRIWTEKKTTLIKVQQNFFFKFYKWWNRSATRYCMWLHTMLANTVILHKIQNIIFFSYLIPIYYRKSTIFLHNTSV